MILRPDVFAARLGDDVVLLDTGVGEYFCLANAAQAFTFHSNAPAQVMDEDLAADALGMGLGGEGQALANRSIRAATKDLGEEARPTRDLVLIPVLAAFGELLLRYHGRPFHQLIRHAATRRRVQAPAMTSRLAEHAQAFRQVLPWAPFQGVCLYRSFFLLAFLRRRGLDAAWVFGVRTWPFEAHCWLQADDVVLDDSIDYVRTFTPILAV